MMKLRENLNSALETVSKNFIHYYAKRDDSNDTIVFMHVEGIALCRIYWFHDDNTTVYLDWMSVSEEHRKNGLGLFMQEMRENIARKMGATKTMLWVVKGTWMREWYERRGYSYHAEYEKENAIWMVKTL